MIIQFRSDFGDQLNSIDCDLTPLDYYFVGRVKSLVNRDKTITIIAIKSVGESVEILKIQNGPRESLT